MAQVADGFHNGGLCIEYSVYKVIIHKKAINNYMIAAF